MTCLLNAESRQLLHYIYYCMQIAAVMCTSACPELAHSACWCRALHWQPGESSPQAPSRGAKCQSCPGNAGPPQVLYNGYTTMQLTKQQAQTYCNTGAPAFPVVDATIDDVHSVRLLTAMSEPADQMHPCCSQSHGH